MWLRSMSAFCHHTLLTDAICRSLWSNSFKHSQLHVVEATLSNQIKYVTSQSLCERIQLLAIVQARGKICPQGNWNGASTLDLDHVGHKGIQLDTTQHLLIRKCEKPKTSGNQIQSSKWSSYVRRSTHSNEWVPMKDWGSGRCTEHFGALTVAYSSAKTCHSHCGNGRWGHLWFSNQFCCIVHKVISNFFMHLFYNLLFLHFFTWAFSSSSSVTLPHFRDSHPHMAWPCSALGSCFVLGRENHKLQEEQPATTNKKLKKKKKIQRNTAYDNKNHVSWITQIQMLSPRVTGPKLGGCIFPSWPKRSDPTHLDFWPPSFQHAFSGWSEVKTFWVGNPQRSGVTWYSWGIHSQRFAFMTVEIYDAKEERNNVW